MRILLVDDDSEFLNATALWLREFGKVIPCTDPKEALKHIHDVQLIISDYEMGPITGNELLAFVKESGALAPVLLLTGHLTKQVAMTAANLQVFRIIEKPFELPVLKAALEEARHEYGRRLTLAKIQFEAEMQNSFPDFKFNELTMTVHYKKYEIRLTEIEFRILTLFIRSKGTMISKDYIVAHVWGGRTLSENLFVTHLGNLRKKLPFLRDHLQVIRGKGYCFRKISRGQE